uniref:Ankyrin 2a, neuronal n=1 Tax=Oncorhynchus tshawytscha TaxID=74940 RepID=A0AAZ3RPI8_ONCTS
RLGKTEIVQLLLQHMAHPDASTTNGYSPLHIAAREGQLETTAVLLEAGASHSLATKKGFTPLHVSSSLTERIHSSTCILPYRKDSLLYMIHSSTCILPYRKDSLLYMYPPLQKGFTPLHVSSSLTERFHSSTCILPNRKDSLLYMYPPPLQKGFTPLHVSSSLTERIHSSTCILLPYRKDSLLLYPPLQKGFTPLHVSLRKGFTPLHVSSSLTENDSLLYMYPPPLQKGFTPLHVSSSLTERIHSSTCILLPYRKDSLLYMYPPPLQKGFTPLHVSSSLTERIHSSTCILLPYRKDSLLYMYPPPLQKGFTPLHVSSSLTERIHSSTCILPYRKDSLLYMIHSSTCILLPNRKDSLLYMIHSSTCILLPYRKDSLLYMYPPPLQKGFTPLHVSSLTERIHSSTCILLPYRKDSLLYMYPPPLQKGFTPLHVSAKYGSLEVAKLLLQRKAMPDDAGKNGLTPLHVAAHYDNQQVALLLLDKGASPHATAKNGYTPLHIAAKKNQTSVVSSLLQYGAETNVLTKQGVTPLHLASQEGHSDMTSLLLGKGAHVNTPTKSGLTPLHLTAQEDRVNAAEVLAKRDANLDQQTKLGYTPLIVACHYGNVKMVNFLLQQGASVNAKTKNGYTPLHQAAQQGHTHIINVLLQHGATPNTTTANGNTALSIARRLGYISVVDTLKVVTEEVITTTTTVTSEKHKMNVPETMTEILDVSDEEGECSCVGQQVSSLSRENEKDSFRLSWGAEHLDNVVLSSSLLHSGFLVSFMVDARGGAMRGCRHNGLRIIVPPRKCSAPTRVTCRLVKRHRLASMPPMVEGEGLAGRIIEVGPTGAQFLGPVIVEIPHFAALRGTERELVILRSEMGESWREHHCEHTEEELNQILNGMDEELDSPEELEKKRICRIVTRDFPQYFAVVSRIKQDSQLIGPEGAVLSSTLVPQVQAVFPEGALTKKIRVGLQAQPISVDLVKRILGNKATFSPIVTLEPRRRKFHKPITMTIPVPKSSTNDGTGNVFGGDTPTLRLLCSITGGTTPAQWEDITGSTPLTFINQCVSFTTNVSARFWLIDCRQTQEAVSFSTQLYREIICVPYMAKFVIFAKTLDPIEARLRCFCMTDDKMDKTLEQQENFTEVARSRDVEVRGGEGGEENGEREERGEGGGGQHHVFSFYAFKENRLALFIKIRDCAQEPCGRLSFTKEPRNYRSLTHKAICNLNITLPTYCKVRHLDTPGLNTMYRKEETLAIIADLLGFSWTELARELEFNEDEIQEVRTENPNSLQEQSHALLQRWAEREGKHATEESLIKRLTKINRMDIVHLIETQMNKSTQEQTSRTYAEIEKTLDQSEGTGPFCLEELFAEDRADSPESFISESEFVESVERGLMKLRRWSPDSVTSEGDYSFLELLVAESRPSSPDSITSNDEYRALSPDSPIPQFRPTIIESAVSLFSRSSSPISVTSDIEESGFYLEDFVNEERPYSPESFVSESEFVEAAEGEDGYTFLELLFTESRPSSPESVTSFDEYRPLSPDSPIPEFRSHCCDYYLLFTEDRSSSPQSVTSDIEFSGFSLEELVVEERQGEMTDIPPQTVTEEHYTDQHGHTVVRKVTREVNRQVMSSEGSQREEGGAPPGEEGDGYSRVVERSVLRSHRDLSEVRVCICGWQGWGQYQINSGVLCVGSISLYKQLGFSVLVLFSYKQLQFSVLVLFSYKQLPFSVLVLFSYKQLQFSVGSILL